MKIIMFSQTWCGPCRQLKPHLEAAAKQLGYEIQTIELDKVDNANELVKEYTISHTPTVFLTDDDGFEVRLVTTDPTIQRPSALDIKTELELYIG